MFVVRASLALLVSVGVSCSPAVFEVMDAAPSDGGDASSDVVAQGDGAPCSTIPTFCEQTDAGFCADFDESALAGAGWTTQNVMGGYNLGIGSTFYVSCPHSVVVDIPALTQGPDGGLSNVGAASLLKDLMTTSKNEVVVDLAVRTVDGAPGTNFTIFEVRSGSGAGVPSSGIVYDAGWQLHAGPTDVPITMPVNQWATLTFDVTFVGTTIMAALTINGGSPINAMSTGNPPTTGASVEVAIGVSTSSSAPPGSINYDNIVVRTP